jgi:hypothetical protein
VPPYRSLANDRRCRNCGAPVYWGRWCVDCVRAVGKMLLLQGLGAAAVWGYTWLWARLR